MTTGGWIFIGLFWGILLSVTFWSYKVLLAEEEEKIAVGPLEDDYHPLSCNVDEKPEEYKVEDEDVT